MNDKIVRDILGNFSGGGSGFPTISHIDDGFNQDLAVLALSCLWNMCPTRKGGHVDSIHRSSVPAFCECFIVCVFVLRTKVAVKETLKNCKQH